MKRFLLIMLVAFMASVGATCQAQSHKPSAAARTSVPEMVREIMEFKLKYIAGELELRDDQKQRFNDVYSKLETERRGIFCKARKLEKKLRNDENVSEEEYDNASNAINEAKCKEAELDKRYDAIFAEFLTKKQIYKLKEAEETFRKKMREMRHKKKEGKMKGGNRSGDRKNR